MNAAWIWIERARRDEPQMVHFRKTVYIEKDDGEEHNTQPKCLLRICADSRYALYVNTKRVGTGPCRAPKGIHYADTLDITPYLKKGENQIYVKVVHYSDQKYDILDFCSGPVSMPTEGVGGLFIEEIHTKYGFDTSEKYEARLVSEYKFVQNQHSGYMGFYEHSDASLFKVDDTDDMPKPHDGWQKAVQVHVSAPYTSGGLQNFWMMSQRTIPMPYEKTGTFKKVWQRLPQKSDLQEEKIISADPAEIFPLTVKPGQFVSIELDAGQLVTAYPKFIINSGKNAQIKITYAESYGSINEQNIYVKGMRDDPHGQSIYGAEDTYVAAEGEQIYSPFNYRAFRLIKIDMQASPDEPLVLKSAVYDETGYPLEISAEFSAKISTASPDEKAIASSDSSEVLDGINSNVTTEGNIGFEPNADTIWQSNVDAIWQISLNTLKCCMYETFMDCPYYEQMQYLMDAFLEMKYTFCVSADGRLAQKAILDFAQSQLPDGMLPCNAPAKITQIIPGFAIYWIFMLETYMMHEDDLPFIRSQLGTMDKILYYFTSRTDEKGLLRDTGYWQFFDWAIGWERGCPVSEPCNINVLYNLLYAYGLRSAAKICDICGRKDTANEYTAQAEQICAVINKVAYDEQTGLYADTPGQKPFSQHAQIFAVLAGAVSDSEKRPLMERMLSVANALSEPSYAMSFFLCRALEQSGLYDKVHTHLKIWDKFKNLIDLHMTTWPEDFITMRSDCHGWSALPLYEFTTCYLGVRPLAPGYKKVGITPQSFPFKECRGIVPTRFGNISVEIVQNNDGTKTVNAEIPAVIEFCQANNASLTEKDILYKIKYI